MDILLLWLFVNVLTRVAGKLNVSKTYIALILSIIGGWIYFYFTNYNLELWQELVKNIGWVYASSQVVFNLLKKLWVLDFIDKNEKIQN